MAETMIGPFRLVEVLGRGGVGVVYRAEDTRLGRRVALRVFENADPVVAARFSSEMRVAARLNIRGVAPVLQFGEIDGRLYEVTDWVDGEDLATRLRNGPLPVPESLRIIASLAETLDALHAEEFLVRDLRPADIVLESETGQPIICALGAASAAVGRTTVSTPDPIPVDALGRLAPERLVDGDVGPATDIYALGGILYELLTGRPPIAGGASPAEVVHRVMVEAPPPPTSIVPDLPAEIDTVIARALAKDPRDRYENARALAAAAATAFRSAPARTDPSTAPPPTPARPKSTRPRPTPPTPAPPTAAPAATRWGIGARSSGRSDASARLRLPATVIAPGLLVVLLVVALLAVVPPWVVIAVPPVIAAAALAGVRWFARFRSAASEIHDTELRALAAELRADESRLAAALADPDRAP